MMKKILIADDDPRLRRLVLATLGNDYELLQACDGEEAMEVGTREKPDLVLLDVMMPKLDGFEVCRRLKGSEATSQIKVVMLTGLGTEHDHSDGETAGADAYFVKPFSPRALLEKIGEMLE